MMNREIDAKNWLVEALGLTPLTEDPKYIKPGYIWYRQDQDLLKIHTDEGIFAIPIMDEDGKLKNAWLPDLAISDTFVVGSVEEQLALDAQRGDVAVRTDIDTSYILRTDDPENFANWQELKGANSAPVQSVNGQTGDVALTTDDVPEGSNLYFTQGNFDSAFGAKSTTDLAEGTNLYWTEARFDASLAAKTTTDLAEGSNLYWTDDRFDFAFGLKTTSDLSEGSNLYYTQARFDTAFGGKTTSDLAEGSNLYWTSARFDTAFSGKSTSDLSEGTNLYYTDSRFDSRLATKDTDDLAEGVSNLYAMKWTDQTGASVSMAVNNGYVADSGSLVTLTLPTTAAVGDRVRVAGFGAGGWKVEQGSGQVIHFGNQDTTSGASGYIASLNRYDAVELVCVVANTDWAVVSSQGNMTVA